MRLGMLAGVLAGVMSVVATAPARAADVLGTWKVGDGSADIQIDNCGGTLWGVVVWERSPGTDASNPDPSLRGRPTLGIPILLGLRPSTQQSWQGSGEVWRGHVYNAKTGETFEVNVRLANQNVLHIEGCVLGGLFCGGQDWSRTNPPPQARRVGKGPGPVCSRLDGRAH